MMIQWFAYHSRRFIQSTEAITVRQLESGCDYIREQQHDDFNVVGSFR